MAASSRPERPIDVSLAHVRLAVSLALAVLILAAIFVISRDRSTSVASGQRSESPPIAGERALPELAPTDSASSREAAATHDSNNPHSGRATIASNGFFSFTTTPSPDGAWVEGFVRDLANRPVRGVTVMFVPSSDSVLMTGEQSLSTRTDESGGFFIGLAHALNDKTLGTLATDDCAFDDVQRPVSLVRGRTIRDVKLVLTPHDVDVWGSVSDSRGEPVLGATLRVGERIGVADEAPSSGALARATPSDATGRFELPCAHGDHVEWLEVIAAGHPPLRVTRDEVGGNWRGVQLKFPQGTTVRGRVVDERGRAVANARVQGKAIDGGSWCPGVSITGADGRFEVGALPSGDVVVQAWKEVSDGRWQPWVGAILELKDGETRELDLAFGAEPAGPVPVGPQH